MRFPMILIAAATVVSACSSNVPHDGETVANESDALYYAAAKIWPTNLIDVCWEAPTAADATERGWVQDQVTKAWETQTGLQFTGWGACPATSSGIRIRVADEWPSTAALGTDVQGKKNGMTLNFVFTFTKDGTQPFAGCIPARSREACIRSIGAHEFGHALGYAHEQNRTDTPATCTQAPQGPNGDTTYGAWDVNSIMSYCNPVYNGNGVISPTDLAGTQSLYGLHPYRPSYALADYGPQAGGWHSEKHPRLVGDMDGDGRGDIVGFGDAGVYVSYGTGTGFTAPAFLIADFGYDHGWRVGEHERLLGDVNGDGKKDIVGFGNDGVFVSYSTGRGFTAPVGVIGDLGSNQGWHASKHVRLLGDVNGDGKKDIVGFGDAGVYVAYSTGTGFAAPIFAVADLGYNQGWRVDQHPRFVADITGDGREDVVGFGNDGVWVSVASARGLAPAAFWLAAFAPNNGGWQASANPRFMADVNGDRKNDIVGFANDGTFVSLATGSGFAAPTRWSTQYGYNDGWRLDRHQRFVTDVNGDGRADLVGFGETGMYASTSTGAAFNWAEFRIRNFGYVAGGWRPGVNPIVMEDVTGDHHADVVGFGNNGVWLTRD